jgi:hypothetical protein
MSKIRCDINVKDKMSKIRCDINVKDIMWYYVKNIVLDIVKDIVLITWIIENENILYIL